MTKTFKIVALLEGISLLLLFFVAMPLKYVWNNNLLVPPVGQAHGILFILYILLAFLIRSEQKWTTFQFVLVCLASMIPFGTFYVEKKYLKA